MVIHHHDHYQVIHMRCHWQVTTRSLLQVIHYYDPRSRGAAIGFCSGGAFFVLGTVDGVISNRANHESNMDHLRGLED